MIAAAKAIIKRGVGEVKNDRIVTYNNPYEREGMHLFELLMNQYGIDVPARVKGWMRDKLTGITFNEKGAVIHYQSRSKSGTGSFGDYLWKLTDKIRSEAI